MLNIYLIIFAGLFCEGIVAVINIESPRTSIAATPRYCEDQLLCPLLNCLRYLCVYFFLFYKIYS